MQMVKFNYQNHLIKLNPLNSAHEALPIQLKSAKALS